MPVKQTDRAKIIASKIRQARDEAGLKNTTLALASGLPRRSVVRLVNGRNAPNGATLEKIAKATRKPLSFFAADAELERIGTERDRIVESLLPFAQLMADLATEAREAAATHEQEGVEHVG